MVAKKNKTTREKLAKLAHELDKAKDLKVKQKEGSKKIMGHPPHFDTTKPKSNRYLISQDLTSSHWALTCFKFRFLQRPL